MIGDPRLEPAMAAIVAGGVVGIPTDTVYGIGCDPRAAAAVERIYAIKGRPADLELGLLAADLEQVCRVAVMGAGALRLAAAFWPGPLSLVVPVREPRSLAVPRAGDTVSVRVPDHGLLCDLLRRTGPLATSSANRHGDPACTNAAEVEARLGAELDVILDGGPAEGRASTIIDLAQATPRVLRSGPLTDEQLRPYLRD